MKKEIICIVCPRGCHMTVEGEGETVTSITGYTCKRGVEYGETEFAHPVRILTTTVKIAGNDRDLLPVRSAQPVPREKLFDCMEVIRGYEAKLPVHQYDVLIHDLCGTGIDLVATKPAGADLDHA